MVKKIMDLNGKNILVVGLARTGAALCRFLAEKGARVTVTDQALAADLEAFREEIAGLGVREELGVPQPQWQGYDLILPSPGVPPETPWLEAARAAGIPVWGELELASHFITRPIYAVSGTNGKTTTTTLLGELLQASGCKPLVGGNIGTPLISLLPRQEEADCLVIEVSSFQLDTAPSFHPQAGILLNITPDHLDRYPDFAGYVASKAGLFRNFGPEDLKVLNADDPWVAALGSRPGRTYYFSTERPLSQGAWVEQGALKVRLASGREEVFPLTDIRLPGRHNLENVMAALLVALDAGGEAAPCREVLASFQGLPHRLEWVGNVGGVDFYDDSKGTNVGAVAQSLTFFNQPVVLIAGGRDKDSDFSLLSSLIRDRVKALVLLGETRDRLYSVWEGLAPAFMAKDMDEAVTQAYQLADPGEVVLLSPACASFDMFRDYAHRGDAFQRIVGELKNARAS
ncbi:MAG: UDP-N-acetylmuramoyl-L-alanine--D-glutamate ligase [Deltaproteobacteria bacterium]|nr:UDP-N-acetylmuramoyl-L-alanine--D-glutamate ligase [Deltaproteobacteria bacterium]